MFCLNNKKSSEYITHLQCFFFKKWVFEQENMLSIRKNKTFKSILRGRLIMEQLMLLDIHQTNQ